MTILAKSPNLFPSTLLTQSTLDARDRQWYALHTRPRQEKSLGRDLLGYQVPFYFPLVKKTSVYGKRKLTSLLPAFPGYVFILASEEERIRALHTNRVIRALEVHDKCNLHYDLFQFEQLITSGAALTAESRLTTGQKVRIRRGPLAGLEGTILSRHGITRLLVSVNFLQQGASVAVDDFMLEQIG